MISLECAAHCHLSMSVLYCCCHAIVTVIPSGLPSRILTCTELKGHWLCFETHHTMIGIVHPVDHGLHGLVRSCGTPDSLLLTHGHLPTTGQHGGRYDPPPVTRSSE